MKPRELLLTRLAETFTTEMQARGFRYSPSGPRFSRRLGPVRQQIIFQSSRWNISGDCTFWTLWSAHNPEHKAWHLQTYGAPAENDWLGGCADWNIPGWSRGPGKHFRLHGDHTDPDEMRVLLQNATETGIPYLDSVSSWAGAATELLRWRWHHDLACDFFLQAGAPDAARDALLTGLRRFEVEGMTGLRSEIPRVRARLLRFFPGAV
jgi:hypothetical protein